MAGTGPLGTHGDPNSRANRTRSLVLASREAPLTACRLALATADGPILITGAPGIGKSWLARALKDDAQSLAANWLCADLSPSTTARDLAGRIARELGLPWTHPAAGQLASLREALADESADSRRWALIVDEAHLASDDLLEELRVVSNELGRADGFAAMIIVGQTALQTRLRSQSLRGLGERIAARAHLRPIDADEALDLLTELEPARDWTVAEVESLHRDAAGNPRRLLQLAERHVRLNPHALKKPARAEASAQSGARPWPHEQTKERVSTLPLVPSPPPVSVGEGIIEVGWPNELDEEPAPASIASQTRDDAQRPNSAAAPSAAHEPWDDWPPDSHAPAVATSSGAMNVGNASPHSDGATSAKPEEQANSDSAAERSNVRIEGEHGFAPYGPLFAKTRP